MFKPKLRRIGLFILLLLALWGGCFFSLSLASEGETILKIHYHRPDQEYEPWNLWVWPFNQDGKVYHFTDEDEFGKVALVKIDGIYDKLGFIIRTDSWRKDLPQDRFVSEFQNNYAEIWLISGKSEIYFSRPDLKTLEKDILDQEPLSKVELGYVNDYIEVDGETVRFLWSSNPGANLLFYLGVDPDNLKAVRIIGDYDPQRGIEIKGLRPGVTYYYKVASFYDGETKESLVSSFTKSEPFLIPPTPEWAKNTVFYEIFVRSFYDGDGDGIGDFKGLKEKIGYLKSLGIDGIWLMPTFESPSYHGYDVIDYYRINPDYGTKADFQELLMEAHNNGIKVILDLVINHTSEQHPWFIEAVKNKENKYREYYLWAEPYDQLRPGPWGQNIWHEYTSTDRYMGIFGRHMPDLNLRNPAVREEMKKIAAYWLDPNGDGDFSDGVDGFRLDASMHIDHLQMDVTHKWWQEFNAYVKSINPEAFLVGENWDSLDIVATFFADMDSSFNFDFATKICSMAGGSFYDLLEIINTTHREYAKVSPDFIDSTFLANHDQNRIATQLGNDHRKAKLAASLLLTLPGTPFIYYGEEIGQLGAKPDEYIREPFDWYTAAKGLGMTDFSGWNRNKSVYTIPWDEISVEEQEKKKDSLLNHYKKLIKIRKEHPAFFYGKYERITTPKGTYGYLVAGEGYELWVIHNYENKRKLVEVKTGGLNLLSGKKTKKKIKLKPYETVIIKFNR
jgi:glycosidase